MGPLETSVRETISELGSMSGVTRPLAELALILAEQLDMRDGGKTGMGIAANAKELRETLKQMMEVSTGGNAIDDLMEQLKLTDEPVSTPLWHPENSRKADPGA